MVTCRYVSSDSTEIALREFDTVGQKAEFSESTFVEVVLGGGVFIPEEDFARCRFTEEQLEKYGRSGDRVNPTEDFCNKLALAQQIYRELRDRVRDKQYSAADFAAC